MAPDLTRYKMLIFNAKMDTGYDVVLLRNKHLFGHTSLLCVLLFFLSLVIKPEVAERGDLGTGTDPGNLRAQVVPLQSGKWRMSYYLAPTNIKVSKEVHF